MSKLYIAYGHGGKDPGAVSGTRKEKDYTLKTGLAVSKYLRQAGHTVIEHRTSDTDFGLTAAQRINDAAKKANASGADYFVDIHYNAGGGKGVECYHAVSGSGKNMAAGICKQVSAIGLVNRGAKSKAGNNGDYFGVIRQTNMPALLVECAFIDTASDMELVDKLGVDVIGKAIATAVIETLGGATMPAQTAPTAPTVPKAPAGGNKQAIVKSLQSELNRQFKRGLAVDGIFGVKTKAACVNVRKGAKGSITKALQQALNLHGYQLTADGIYGVNTQQAVKAFQKANGLNVDGVAGATVFEKLLG